MIIRNKQKTEPASHITITKVIENESRPTLSRIRDDISTLPIIPPMFIITPLRALTVLFSLGITTSEHIANWFPVGKKTKKYPNMPNRIKG